MVTPTLAALPESFALAAALMAASALGARLLLHWLDRPRRRPRPWRDYLYQPRRRRRS